MATVNSGLLTLPTMTGGPFTDLRVIFKADDFHSTSIDGGAASIANGGGNLRMYTASDKVTQLSLDVVRFVTGGTPDIEVWVKVPSANTGTTVYYETDDAVSAQPAVDAAFGRQSVWTGYAFVSHDGGLTDSSGALTMINDGSGAVTTSPFGAALTAPLQRLQDATVANFSTDFCWQIWHSGTSEGTLMSRRDGSSHQYHYMLYQGNYTHASSGDTSLTSMGAFASGWHGNTINVNTGADIDHYVDGALVSSALNKTSITGNINIPLRIGYRGQGGLGTTGFAYPGLVGEIRAKSGVLSAAQIAVEYDNQNASTAWVSSSTWSGAGAAVKGIQFTWRDKAEVAKTSLSGIEVAWFDQNLPGNFLEPTFKTSIATTDGTGTFEIDLDSSTALSIGGTGFLIAYDTDGSDHKNTELIAGQFQVVDIS